MITVVWAGSLAPQFSWEPLGTPRVEMVVMVVMMMIQMVLTIFPFRQ